MVDLGGQHRRGMQCSTVFLVVWAGRIPQDCGGESLVSNLGRVRTVGGLPSSTLDDSFFGWRLGAGMQFPKLRLRGSRS